MQNHAHSLSCVRWDSHVGPNLLVRNLLALYVSMTTLEQIQGSRNLCRLWPDKWSCNGTSQSSDILH